MNRRPLKKQLPSCAPHVTFSKYRSEQIQHQPQFVSPELSRIKVSTTFCRRNKQTRSHFLFCCVGKRISKNLSFSLTEVQSLVWKSHRCMVVDIGFQLLKQEIFSFLGEVELIIERLQGELGFACTRKTSEQVSNVQNTSSRNLRRKDLVLKGFLEEKTQFLLPVEICAVLWLGNRLQRTMCKSFI